MIDVSFNKDTHTFTLRLSGVVNDSDYDAAHVQFEELAGAEYGVRVRGAGPGVHFLLDWAELEAWGQGARSVGTMFALSIRDAVSRVAVIADTKWHGEKERLDDVINRGTVRFFTPDQRSQAIEWLAS